MTKSGNEAEPVYRWVRVINQAYIFRGTYTATENQVFPSPETCVYNTYIDLDSSVNFRLVFDYLTCQKAYGIYADVTDTIIVIPFQMVSDSLVDFSIQGSGFINDCLIHLNYQKTEGAITRLWESQFLKLQ
ncbi:MAG: hypothetical protein R2764_01840 [Bacteroidales bacterium]